MGVATAGSLLFRQIGGSVGIAIFGAIFANHLQSNLASLLPPGVHGPKNVSPDVVRHLPPFVHDAYVRAIAESLHPVFVVAAVIAVFAFLLTWLLREVPLRQSTPHGRGGARGRVGRRDGADHCVAARLNTRTATRVSSRANTASTARLSIADPVVLLMRHTLCRPLESCSRP